MKPPAAKHRATSDGKTHMRMYHASPELSDPHFPDCRREREEDERNFRMKAGCQYLVNVGTIGYPRVRPYSTYALFDPESGEVQFREVDFDFRGYAKAMRASSIPVPPWVEECVYF